MLLLVSSCGRPDIDPAPFLMPCSRDAGCAAPYECTALPCQVCLPDAGPNTFCLVACRHDGDCPSGFFCNGDTMLVTEKLVGYCFRE